MDLGDHVRDKITGFEGVVVARTEWLWGYVRWGVQSTGLTAECGVPLDVEYFDDGSIELMDEDDARDVGIECGARP